MFDSGFVSGPVYARFDDDIPLDTGPQAGLGRGEYSMNLEHQCGDIVTARVSN